MPSKTSWMDRIVAALLAAAVVMLLSIWPFQGLHPQVWTETATAAGLLPPDHMLPGIGVYLAHLVFAVLPAATALSVMGWLAKLSVAVCVYLAYGAISGILDLMTASVARDPRRRRLAVRLSSGIAALMLGCSDPFWCAAQGVSGSLFVVFLVILSLWLFVRLLRQASYSSAVLTLFVLAVLCAESPIGWFLFFLLLCLTRKFLSGDKSESWAEFLDPIKMQRTKWSVTFVFLGVLILAVLFECFVFAMLDGLKANGRFASEFPVLYGGAYFGLILNGANVIGTLSLLAVVVLPAGLAFLMGRTSTDEENYLPFKMSVVYFLCGLVAFLQLSPVSVTWFWQAVEGVQIKHTLILTGTFLSAITLAWALFVLLVEILCRDYEHIESVLFQGYQEEMEDRLGSRQAQLTGTVESVRLGPGRWALLLVPAVLLGFAVWGRQLPNDRQLQALVHQYVNELVDEAEGAKYLFTEGAFDNCLRLEAYRRGVELRPIAVIGGQTLRDSYMRQIGTEGLEDRLSLQAGAAEALRTWVVTKSPRLAECAVQLAFELLGLNRRLEPVVYGALVRPVGGDADSAAASVSRCHALADRIAELHDQGVWRHAVNPLLKDRFLFVQFRLAVMSRLRAIRLDPQMKTRESIEEIAYADRLNERNPSLRKILRHMDWVRRQNGAELTPREGLALALRRADFTMARRYAMPVLFQDPDEPNANFALGMSYYVEEQYAKAEEYLKRVLKRSPDEASAYNNLALVYLKTDRLKEAAEAAAKALELKPDQAEVLDTVRQIEAAQKEKGNIK